MGGDDRAMVVLVVIGVVALILVSVGTYYAAKASCYSTWEASGMPVTFAMFSGCRVQRKDGTWIPASSYRNVD